MTMPGRAIDDRKALLAVHFDQHLLDRRLGPCVIVARLMLRSSGVSSVIRPGPAAGIERVDRAGVDQSFDAAFQAGACERPCWLDLPLEN